MRLARRGHAARSRVLILYGLLLTALGFAVVWSFYHLRSPTRLIRGYADPMPVAEVRALFEWLAIVLLEAQLLLVATVTPAFAASAISEEKDRETLPLLLATDLTDREIIWGKAIGRVIYLLFAVLAGVPVLMITLFLGGVDLSLLAAGYALAAGTTILAAAIGVSAACQTADTRTALVRAYGQSAILVGGVLVPPFVFLSPFAMLIYTRLDFAEHTSAIRFACGFGYPIAQVIVAAVIVATAARSLRKAGATAEPVDRTAYPEPPRGRPAPIVFAPWNRRRCPCRPSTRMIPSSGRSVIRDVRGHYRYSMRRFAGWVESSHSWRSCSSSPGAGSSSSARSSHSIPWTPNARHPGKASRPMPAAAT